MHLHGPHRRHFGFMCALAALVVASAAAQDVPPHAYPLDQLELRLKPMTKEQLQEECNTWFGHLQKAVRAVSDARIAIIRFDERAAADAKAAAAAKAEAKQEADEKQEAAESAPSTDTETPAPESEHAQKEAEAAAAKAEAVAKQADEAKVEQKSEREQMLEKQTELQSQRTAVIERFDAVLDAFENKGGDPSEYRAYITAVVPPIIEEVNVFDLQQVRIALYQWLTDPSGGLAWARKITLFLVLVIAFWILSRIAAGAMKRGLGVTNTSHLLREFLVNNTRRLVFFIGLIVAVGALGVPTGPLLAFVGAGGLVVGLALQGTLSNFASGILILLYRPFDVGDAIDAGGVAGVVKGLNLVSTTIYTFDNQRVIVPNNAVWGGVITNITGNPTRRIDLVFGIGYDDDIVRAQQILEQLVKEHKLILDDPAPVVKLHELADSSVNFVVRPWSKTSDYWTVYWDLTRAVKERFDAEGVSIPYPQQDVHMHHVAPASASADA